MRKLDLLFCNPKDFIYPWSNWRLNRDRDLFGKVIIMMTGGSWDKDYSDYLEKTIRDVTIIREFDDDGSDWRNAAINRGIKAMRGDKMLFLEQDFLYEDGFMEALFKVEGYHTIGFRDGNRFHPACLLVDKETIFKTQRDFSVSPDVGDHFYKFTCELENIGNWTSLETLDLPKHFHLSGLTQNYRLDENWHHPVPFNTYNIECQKLEQPDSWLKISKATQNKMSAIGTDEAIKEYFK